MKILDRDWYPKRRFWIAIRASWMTIHACSSIPGPVRAQPRDLLEGLRKDEFKPEDVDLIVNTHSHPDHSGTNNGSSTYPTLRSRSTNPKRINENDATTLMRFFARFLGVAEFKADLYLSDKLGMGEMPLEVLHTPGRSPRAFCFIAGPKILVLELEMWCSAGPSEGLFSGQ